MKDPEGWGYYSRFEQGFFQIPTLSRGVGGGGGGGCSLMHYCCGFPEQNSITLHSQNKRINVIDRKL